MKKISTLLLSLFFLLSLVINCYAVSLETEPNNDASTADPLIYDEPITGQTSSSYDKDWYSISTSGSDVIYLRFEGTYSNPLSGAWSISIIDASDNILAKRIHLSYDETANFAFAVTDPGIYYVVIEANKDYLQYDYTLSVSLSNPGESNGATTNNVDYDVEGIWQLAGQNNFISVHVNNSVLIGITYFPGAGESFILGDISGNTGHITYSSDVAQFDATIVFTSSTTGVITVNSCVPFSGDYCLFPPGVTINAVKIF